MTMLFGIVVIAGSGTAFIKAFRMIESILMFPPSPPPPPYPSPSPYPYHGYPPRHRRHVHGYGYGYGYGRRYGSSMFLGGIIGFTTAALLGMALDDAKGTYREITDERMKKCSSLLPSIEKKIKDSDCHWLQDGSQVCFFKTGTGKESEKACYYNID